MLRLIVEDDDLGKEAFGSLWASKDTPWAEAASAIDWANEADGSETGRNLFLQTKYTDERTCLSCAETLTAAGAAARHSLIAAFGMVAPNIKDSFGKDELDDVPIELISERLSQWQENLPCFNDWVAARESLEDTTSMERPEHC